MSCSRLEKLDISGSLRFGDPSIPVLIEFLRTSQHLREFTISGIGDRVLSFDDLRGVFRAIEVNRSLETIACCNHGVGPKFLLFISDVLLLNRKVSRLKIEGNKLHDMDVLLQVAEKWQGRGRPLEVPWLEDDVEHICAQNPAAVSSVPLLRAMWETIAKGDPSIEVPSEQYEHSASAPVSASKLDSGETSHFFGPSSAIAGPQPPPEPLDRVGEKRHHGRHSVSDPKSGHSHRSICGIVLVEQDPIGLPRPAEYPVPLPTLPPLDNAFVTARFEDEFRLMDVIAHMSKSP
jgi:hypothetical protein